MNVYSSPIYLSLSSRTRDQFSKFCFCSVLAHGFILFAGTIPAKLVLQLTTAFRERGLCDRSGKLFYKDHLGKCNVPILAIAGDQDLICPPEAVEGM